ncbi:hypothetical protein ITI46_31830 [Streptomyces oryzae]|uniref:GntR family transcriptional regulator n=2 Tax=Streptomyces oryzae TaxID=1434886 RepID=A0ABS3XLB2_9ACTN|nr:hypothetical protein [Streptomyces oryzae]
MATASGSGSDSAASGSASDGELRQGAKETGNEYGVPRLRSARALRGRQHDEESPQ